MKEKDDSRDNNEIPKKWDGKRKDPRSGRYYYYNKKTKETQWTKPTTRDDTANVSSSNISKSLFTTSFAASTSSSLAWPPPKRMSLLKHLAKSAKVNVVPGDISEKISKTS